MKCKYLSEALKIKTEELHSLLEKEWEKENKDLSLIELLNAHYWKAFKEFEEMVWSECCFDKNELIIKRFNDSKKMCRLTYAEKQ
jgi:hypothetical protein